MFRRDGITVGICLDVNLQVTLPLPHVVASSIVFYCKENKIRHSEGLYTMTHSKYASKEKLYNLTFEESTAQGILL